MACFIKINPQEHFAENMFMNNSSQLMSYWRCILWPLRLGGLVHYPSGTTMRWLTVSPGGSASTVILAAIV